MTLYLGFWKIYDRMLMLPESVNLNQCNLQKLL